MNKDKVEVYREVLRDVSQNFDGAEKFIKHPREDICGRKKNLSKRHFIFIYFLFF